MSNKRPEVTAAPAYLSIGLYTGALTLPPAARGDGPLDIKAIARKPLPLTLAVREFASVC
jgi:hypothetical protein